MSGPLLPRLLLLIGSGETGPQMGKLHRSVVKRLAGDNRRSHDVTAAIIDTPFGFQENADALGAELLDYFGRRLGMNAALASFRRSDEEVLARETAFARIASADYVFSGPGSPSYALRIWSGTRVPDLLAEKLRSGGAIVLASAAALTAGRLTVPVYEIYKVGVEPRWLPGLDLISEIGIHAAVVPHYDNADGSGHDTRFCFLGERRLVALEEQMPADVYVLGIDEHTALLIDIDSGTASVYGRGSVTIRDRGESDVRATGSEFPIDDLRRSPASPAASTVRRAITESRNADMAQRLLELEARVATLSDRARLAGELIDALVQMRTTARDEGDFQTADEIRSRLLAAGVELTDSATGTTARLRDGPSEG